MKLCNLGLVVQNTNQCTSSSIATTSHDVDLTSTGKPILNTRLSDLYSLTSSSQLGSDRTIDPKEKYNIINTNCLKSLVSSLACPVCFQTTISLKVSDKIGFANKLEVECSECILKVAETYTSEKVGSPFDINRRMVENFVSVGQGFSAMENSCMVTNVEVLSSNVFYKHASSMVKLAVEAGESNLEKAREYVRQVYRQLASESEPTPAHEPIDIAVSFDGTWHKRGHT